MEAYNVNFQIWKIAWKVLFEPISECVYYTDNVKISDMLDVLRT